MTICLGGCVFTHSWAPVHIAHSSHTRSGPHSHTAHTHMHTHTLRFTHTDTHTHRPIHSHARLHTLTHSSLAHTHSHTDTLTDLPHLPTYSHTFTLTPRLRAMDSHIYSHPQLAQIFTPTDVYHTYSQIHTCSRTSIYTLTDSLARTYAYSHDLRFTQSHSQAYTCSYL